MNVLHWIELEDVLMLILDRTQRQTVGTSGRKSKLVTPRLVARMFMPVASSKDVRMN